MTEREKELIKKGLQLEEKERGDLIDNCYRAGLLRDSWPNVPQSTETLRKLYDERLRQLFPHNYS